MLLALYRAMFRMSQTGRSDGQLRQAVEQRGSFTNDIVAFKEEINMPAVAQHLGMLTHLKAWEAVRNGNNWRGFETFYHDPERETKIHPSCGTTPRNEQDSMYQKSSQSHPAFYFNNIGLAHVRMKRYAMATMYLSKALKFTEKSDDKYMAHPAMAKGAKVNPNEFVNNQASQKTQEILYNFAVSLYKSKKYHEAFKCFEKLTLGVVASNPKLWYHMGCCAMHLNKQIFEQQETSQSDVYHSKLGYGLPHYVKLHGHQKLKRFVLAPKGDPIVQMEAATRDFELAKVEESKKAFLDTYRQQNADTIDKMTKTALKKHEKVMITSW